MLEREKVKYFEAKLEEMEKEKRALSSTLEAKQSKIDHMLKGGADETTNQKRSEVSHLFEKDIIALSENIIGQLVQNQEQYTAQHIQQDIHSLQKLISVSFQAIRKNSFTDTSILSAPSA